MYSEYFLLKKSPFQLLLDADMVYWGNGLKAVWGEITCHLGNGQSPQFIQGQAGSGKTLLLHLLALRSIELGHNCAYIDAADRKADLFESLSQAYGLDYPTKSEEQYLTWFESFLASSRLGGVQNVLLLDNMHRLDEESLQKLVYLVRIRIDNTPLLHVVAATDSNLPDHVLAILEDHKIPLKPQRLAALSEEETAAYLRHRLRCAGHPDGDLFDPEVVRWIHDKSHGLPREINFYADLLLTHAFLQQEKRVIEALIKRVDPSYALQGQHLRPISESRLESSAVAVPLDRPPLPEETGTVLPGDEQPSPAGDTKVASDNHSSHPSEATVTAAGAPTSPTTLKQVDGRLLTSPPHSPPPEKERPSVSGSGKGESSAGHMAGRTQEPDIDVDNLGSLPFAAEATPPLEEAPRVEPADDADRAAAESSAPPASTPDEQPQAAEEQQGGSKRRWMFIAMAALLMIAFGAAALLSSRLPGTASEESVAKHSSSDSMPVMREEESLLVAQDENADQSSHRGEETPDGPAEAALSTSPSSDRSVAKDAPSGRAEIEKQRPPSSTEAPAVSTKVASVPEENRSDRQAVPSSPKQEVGSGSGTAPRANSTTTAERFPGSEASKSPPLEREAPSRTARAATTPVTAGETTPSDSSEFARFSPEQEKTDHLLPLAALDSLVRRFQWAYENGDENLLGELFDEAIRTNESEGRENIIGEYRQFFSVTQARRLEIGPVEWQTSGTTATGVARFTAHVVTTKGRERTFHGTLTIETRSTPRGLRITALFYRYDG